MGARDILNHLCGRGIKLSPLPDGRIGITHGGKLTDADRAEIRAHKPELVALLQRQQPTRQPAPAPEIKPAVRLLCGMDDHEIAQMLQRVNVARRAGYSLDDAEQIADRLLWRDRTGLDMHACLECRRLSGRRCTARRPQPFDHRDVHELRRCPAFSPTKDGT
jgi:hypothetical protein